MRTTSDSAWFGRASFRRWNISRQLDPLRRGSPRAASAGPVSLVRFSRSSRPPTSPCSCRRPAAAADCHSGEQPAAGAALDEATSRSESVGVEDLVEDLCVPPSPLCPDPPLLVLELAEVSPDPPPPATRSCCRRHMRLTRQRKLRLRTDRRHRMLIVNESGCRTTIGTSQKSTYLSASAVHTWCATCATSYRASVLTVTTGHSPDSGRIDRSFHNSSSGRTRWKSWIRPRRLPARS